MSFKLKITISVINRRILEGKKLDDILLNYPKLTTDDIEIIKQEVTE